jgi:CarD family transcriptional regulator
MSQNDNDMGFNIGDAVVYPSHGVGTITSEEVEVIAGIEMKLYVIKFSEDKMLLRVPKSRALKAGLRHLSSKELFGEVISTLKSRAQTARGMWSKRAQEYETKINSGDPLMIAEVLRDLYRNADDPERSYSERTIYEMALERLTHEYAAAHSCSNQEAESTILQILDDAKFEMAG